MMKVRVKSWYRFEPIGWDVFRPAHQGLKRGDIVRVVNLPGCPPANTMGHCHVERDGVFMGLVQCGSLHHCKRPQHAKPERARAKLARVRAIVGAFLDASDAGEAADIDTGAVLFDIADITHPRT